MTHTETAEEVRKDWEVGEFSFYLFFSQRISHTRQRPSERTTVHELLNEYQYTKKDPKYPLRSSVDTVAEGRSGRLRRSGVVLTEAGVVAVAQWSSGRGEIPH